MSAAANSFDSCQAAQLMHVVCRQPIMFLLGSGKLQHCPFVHTHMSPHTARTVTYLVLMCCKAVKKMTVELKLAPFVAHPCSFQRFSALHTHVQLWCKVMLHSGLSERLAAFQGWSCKDYSWQERPSKWLTPQGYISLQTLPQPALSSSPCLLPL